MTSFKHIPAVAPPHPSRGAGQDPPNRYPRRSLAAASSSPPPFPNLNGFLIAVATTNAPSGPSSLSLPAASSNAKRRSPAAQVENLEKALVLCTPYKIGPFQSEIDKPLDMNSARERHGLGPVPKKEDLINEILNEKPPEMARPLGDAYSEYYLKKKGIIPEDYYLEEGWDKEEVRRRK